MVSCQASFFAFGDVGGAVALLGVADYGHGSVAVVNARHAVAADSPYSIIEGTDETHEGGGHLGVEGEREEEGGDFWSCRECDFCPEGCRLAGFRHDRAEVVDVDD